MAERKAYTEEQKAEIKRRRDERNAAMRTIVALLTSGKELSPEDIAEMQGLAEVAAPKSGGRSGSGGSSRVAVMDVVSGIFDDVKEISEDQIFIDHKLGRTEMTTAIKNIIKKYDPKERKWISFDPETGVYKLEGKGPKPPRGWTGYVPVDETLEDDDEE